MATSKDIFETDDLSFTLISGEEVYWGFFRQGELPDILASLITLDMRAGRFAEDNRFYISPELGAWLDTYGKFEDPDVYALNEELKRKVRENQEDAETFEKLIRRLAAGFRFTFFESSAPTATSVETARPLNSVVSGKTFTIHVHTYDAWQEGRPDAYTTTPAGEMIEL